MSGRARARLFGWSINQQSVQTIHFPRSSVQSCSVESIKSYISHLEPWVTIKTCRHWKFSIRNNDNHAFHGGKEQPQHRQPGPYVLAMSWLVPSLPPNLLDCHTRQSLPPITNRGKLGNELPTSIISTSQPSQRLGVGVER